MPRATGYAARAPALAIADFVRQRGAVYSTEILDRFGIGYSSLRRRRLALRWLGIVFVENGAGSFYATEALTWSTSALLTREFRLSRARGARAPRAPQVP